jgi:sporulation protein YlmC with PRC-barrel domain
MASRGELSFYRDLLDKPVCDKDGLRIGALADLAAEPSPAPTIAVMVVRPARGRDAATPLIVPWDAVAAIEPRVIRLTESCAALTSMALATGAILLRRHVMDQQVVDCRGAKLQRVNDITIGLSGRDLCLCGMDTGLRGLLTRLGHRWGLLHVIRPLYRRVPGREIGWDLVDRVEPARGHIRLRLPRDEVRSAGGGVPAA